MELRMEMRNATCGYDGKPVVKKATFSVSEGEVLCLLGPNGSGKTTLFKTILGLLKLQNGEILLDGVDTRTWPRRKIAQVIGYVPQAHAPTFPFDVVDMVLMGRTAHLGTFATPSEEDKRIALEAIEKLGISYLKDRVYTEISGVYLQGSLFSQQLQHFFLEQVTHICCFTDFTLFNLRSYFIQQVTGSSNPHICLQQNILQFLIKLFIDFLMYCNKLGHFGNKIIARFSQRLLKFRKESSHINHNPLKIIKFMPYFTTKRRTSSLQLMKYDAVHHFRGCIHRAERKPAWKPLVPP
jgi:ABC-type enterochelin transport system ATPase subunit